MMERKEEGVREEDEEEVVKEGRKAEKMKRVNFSFSHILYYANQISRNNRLEPKGEKLIREKSEIVLMDLSSLPSFPPHLSPLPLLPFSFLSFSSSSTCRAES